MMPALQPSDLTGQTLDGRYRIVGPIGEGAMGNVYRAEDVKIGRPVAVKVMNETLSSADPSARKRFDREARAMARLEHPHCASVLDVGVHGEAPFVVMELVSGMSLKDLVEQGPVPIERAVEITRQVLSGLAHAHELGIVHRDIKPANIMLSQKAAVGDHAKVLDFGLARMSGETSNLTAGVVLGTPSYMAPEQVRGILLDGRADLYACGVMLFELLTGTKPFRSEVYDPIAVCMLHMSEPVPRLDERLPGRPFGALQAVIDRAMAKDRENRFQTATAFVDALDAVVRVKQDASGDAATAALPATALVAVGATSVLGAAPTQPVAPQAVAPRRSSSRNVMVLSVIGGLVIVGIVVLATRGHSGAAQTPRDASVASATPPIDANTEGEIAMEPASGDSASAVLARANELVAAGRDMAAIDLLVKSRRAHPKDARIPFLAGKLFARKMYFQDAFKHLRPAFALDSSLRNDAELADSIVRGFNAKQGYDGTIAGFLRSEMPEAAKPILERTAASHSNAMVRKRAASELRRYP